MKKLILSLAIISLITLSVFAASGGSGDSCVDDSDCNIGLYCWDYYHVCAPNDPYADVCIDIQVCEFSYWYNCPCGGGTVYHAKEMN